jgi:transcription-repair coupling factor (superfamily II helicase)
MPSSTNSHVAARCTSCNDKVKNIEFIAGMIRKLVPGVRVGVGHGQLEGHKLEEVMMRLHRGQHRCARVHHHRGERPRHPERQHHHRQRGAEFWPQRPAPDARTRGPQQQEGLLLPAGTEPAPADPTSRKRLVAIEQFSDLGSGIHIAMKDLDIRGAGDLLGAEQSGFINDIGFETYHKILDEAVRELKDEHFKELFDARSGASWPAAARRDQSDDCIIETDLTMLIPNSYVSETAERLALYRKLDDIKDEAELQKFTAWRSPIASDRSRNRSPN